MNVSGERFIEIICKKLKEENKLLHDAIILSEIRKLSEKDMEAIVHFGIDDLKKF